MLNIIIFSKNRSCQLELLLRSLKIYLQDWQLYSVNIIFSYTNREYEQGYEIVKKQFPSFNYFPESQDQFVADSFKQLVLECFKNDHPYTMFLVDDLVFKSPVNLADNTFQTFINDSNILCLSLRLSPDIEYCYTSNIFSPPPPFDTNLVWDWQKQPKNSDWGYPMSLDGHIFRTLEIYDLIESNRSFNNPNTLETQLALRPISAHQMICYAESKIVNIPANKVQNIYSNRHAQMSDLNDLNQHFLNGYRLSLKPILETKNISVHQEIPLQLFNPFQNISNLVVGILCRNDILRLVYQIESLLCQSILPSSIICIVNEESSCLETSKVIELTKNFYYNIEVIVNYNTEEAADTSQSIRRENNFIFLDIDKNISSTFIEDYLNETRNLEGIDFYNLQQIKHKNEYLTSNLEQVESQFRYQLEITNSQLQQTKLKLQQTESELQQSRSQLLLTESRLQQTKSQLQQEKINLKAIQSSKFWKIREKWFEIRKKIGISNEDQGFSLLTLYKVFNNKFNVNTNAKKDNLVVIEQKQWSRDLPLVSVIIPCYNYGKYLEEAIDSVLAQTYKNFEIIVVDDGSTDPDTIILLRKLNKPKTKIVRTNNFKLPAARNNGIKEAKGKYICCLDADDLLKPTYLEKCLFRLEAENVDVCYTWVQEFGDSQAVIPTKEFDIDTLMIQNCLHVSAVFKRSMWEAVGGYNESMVEGYEDWDFWLAIAKTGGIGAKIDEPLFLYRKHGSSMISSALAKHDALYMQVKNNHKTLYVNKKAIKEITRNRKKYIVNNRFVNLRHPFQENHIKESKKTHNILFALPWMTTGGVDTVILQLIKTLKIQGFDVTVCTTSQTTPDMGDSTARYEEITPKIYNLCKLINSDIWEELVFYLIESQNIEIIFLSGSSYFYDILQDIKDKFPAIKIVDQLYNEFGHINNNRKYSRFIDINIAENESVANCLLLEHQEQSDRVQLINNGVDTNYFDPNKVNNIEIIDNLVPKDKFIISFLGRFSQEKCPKLFVEIANHLKNDDALYFVMAGNGYLYNEILELIKRYGLENKVYLPGFVDSRDYLRISNLLVLPSEIDGRPNSVLESLSMGVPVISSSVGGLPKIIKDEYNGFLCASGDIKSFVSCIQKVITDKELYLSMRKNARNYAVEFLDINIVQSKYIRLFEELLLQNVYE
ncbi:glycosyltransferase [Pseudanabaena minima]|uniref:glycosyltransferase n=1 Tax=Pseudanabaena minima TaxID=890415 RepID=UPI003DA85C2E